MSNLMEHGPPIRRAIAFAGGGIVGGCYMLGVTEALNVALLDESQTSEASMVRKSFFDVVEDRLGMDGFRLLQDPRTMSDFSESAKWDFYREADPVFSLFTTWQGISAGSIMAGACAQQIPIHGQFLSMFRGSENAFQPSIFFAPNFKQWKRLLLKIPMAVLDLMEQAYCHQGQTFLETASNLVNFIPEGLLTGERLQKWVQRQQQSFGKTDDFRDLPPGISLYILACAINRAGEVIYFGSERYKTLPISLAIRASCSLPGIDAVRIQEPNTGRPLILKDGGLSRSVNITHAFQKARQDFIIAINPIVPLRTDLELEFDNLPAMAESYYRILYYQRLYRLRRKDEQLYRRYHGRFLLLEPDPREWFYNMLNPYRTVESFTYGFEQTLVRFYNDYDRTSKILANGQLRLREKEVLEAHVKRISRRRKHRRRAVRRLRAKAVFRTLRDAYSRLALGT